MNSTMEPTAAAATQWLLEVSVKAAMVMGVVWGMMWIPAIRRSSAAARHGLWSLAVGAVLGLPFLTLFLPAWHVRLPRPAVATLPPSIEKDTFAGSGSPLIALTPDTEEVSPALIDETASSPPVLADGIIAATTGKLHWYGSPECWILGAWAIGVAICVLPTAVGMVSLWILRRRSRRVTGGPLLAALQHGTSQFRLRRSVQLYEGDSRSMPMTWGFWRPIILLPDQAERWTSDRLQAVLLHELAHVQRGDCLTQLLAQAARALYWFNPLVWLAERRLRTEQEQACDDLVLRSGVPASAYAEHLFAVSTSCRSLVGVAGFALAMARVSRIERRLLSILDPRQNRTPPSRGRIGWAIGAAAMALSLLAVLGIEPMAGAQQPGAGSNQTAKAAAIPIPLAEVRARITEQYVASVADSEIIQGAIKGIMAALRDPSSDYLTPEMVAEMERQIGGTLVGIGVQLESHEKQPRVVTALLDSPALSAGIQPGDVILQIDGQPTVGSELSEVVKRVAGPQGTVVRLKIRRDPQQELDIAVTRGPVKLASVRGFRRGPDNRWNHWLDHRQMIGYAQVAHFGTVTPQELRAALQPLTQQGLKALILDLRFCPGGTLDAAVDVVKMFLANGTIVSLQARGGEPVERKADGSNVLGDFPLVVLVNGQTASAAEVAAGALQDNRRAVVLGTRTFGKGSVQTLIKLTDDNGAIKLTTSRYRLPSGRSIDRRPEEQAWGIDPDEGFFVPATPSQQAALLARRQEREVIGPKTGGLAKPDAEISARILEEQEADPQLAAALTALTARLTSGQFARVSRFTAAEIAQFIKREEVELRREAALKDLQKIDRELAELNK